MHCLFMNERVSPQIYECEVAGDEMLVTVRLALGTASGKPGYRHENVSLQYMYSFEIKPLSTGIPSRSMNRC